MATTSVPDDDEGSYTPAGDVDAVLAALEDVDVEATGAESAGGRGDDAVLPSLDAALEELAAAVDAPTHDPATDDASAADAGDRGGLTRERADFDAVAESTDVDSIPYENAAAFLANTLYAVPPANTRFQWVEFETEVEDPTPDWDLDVDW